MVLDIITPNRINNFKE